MNTSTASIAKLWLGLATPAVIGGIVGRDLYLHLSQALGQASLEIFRGEQLPLLKINQAAQANAEPD